MTYLRLTSGVDCAVDPEVDLGMVSKVDSEVNSRVDSGMNCEVTLRRFWNELWSGLGMQLSNRLWSGLWRETCGGLRCRH